MAEENATQLGDSTEHTDLIVESARDKLEALLPPVHEFVLVEAAKFGGMKNPYILKHSSVIKNCEGSGNATTSLTNLTSRALEYHPGDIRNGVTWTMIQRLLRQKETAASAWAQTKLQQSLDRINRTAPSKWLTALEARYTALVAEKESEQEAAERVKRERKGKVETYLAKLNSLRLAPELINVLTNILT
jgi:hypothetical protein